MLRFIKQSFLNSHQGALKRKYPALNMTLHADMPRPSISKMSQLAPLVAAVNVFEPQVSALSDDALKAKTQEFRLRIAERNQAMAPEIRQLEEELFAVAIPEEKDKIKEKIKLARNKVFEDTLPEAFAVVREASKRTIGLRHFDVQIAGGIILHEGRIAEMSTGEGKTLVATLPAYLNALLDKGVHVVTVNDYLARRDREWMGAIYEFLGLSVGVIQHDMSDEQRRRSYACDITYGTNNEFGFDYLRDNMKYSLDDLVQRPFFFAIVDEVDSILIDEARTPLIISGPTEAAPDKYYTAKRIVDQMKGRRVTEKDEIDAKYKGIDLSTGFDYVADEKAQTVALTEMGEEKASKMWGIESMHTIETIEYRHHIIAALRAKEFFDRDVDYVVKDGEVIIVDEFTGRLMPGRRWSDGLHQAVEAKEGLKIEKENQTLATVTFQNYFRMYEKLAGMTGTAYTEANEFKGIYQLDVVAIPTNRPLIRTNHPDRVYKTEKEKFNAVVEEIVELHKKGTPVLVGTISIEKSELLSEMLKRRGVAHQVLNAKYHELEAQIVAQAGRFKGVTIATNMAGRGTDILLGGNADFMARSMAKQKLDPLDPAYQTEYGKILERIKKETIEEHENVVSCGGLYVLGTERHEARRIDNQLRGRCGRQGDPGASRFYVSLADDLMRLFGSDKLAGVMEKLGLEEGQVIEHPWVAGSIEIAQKRVEQHNFEIRKQLLEYDNVMNKQREIIYTQRRQTLEGASLKENIIDILNRLVDEIVDGHSAMETKGEADPAGLINNIYLKFGIKLDEPQISLDRPAQLKDQVRGIVTGAYEQREQIVGPEVMRNLERMVFLQIIDSKWKDHLYAMDSLREGIGLRAYGQRDPLVEYKREAFGMFSQLIAGIEDEAVEVLFKMEPAQPQDRMRGVFSSVPQRLEHPDAALSVRQSQNQESPHEAGDRHHDPDTAHTQSVHASGPKVGRNDPCLCGSGKKYKKCCGQ
jgi:preprotein translocase subunit SecA